MAEPQSFSSSSSSSDEELPTVGRFTVPELEDIDPNSQLYNYEPAPGTLFKRFQAKRRLLSITPVEPLPETHEGKFVFQLFHA